MGPLFALVLGFLAVFLILLVLVQRGRGGGLAGALGGMGGSSAFGAKAGDIFTRITIVVVAIWITISILAVHWAKNRADKFGESSSSSSTTADPLQQTPLPPAEEPATSTAPAATPAAGEQQPAATGSTPIEEPAGAAAVPVGGTPAEVDR
jgi:preprotein translocase subunit SecG